MLLQINEIFPPLNNVGILFPLLLSCEAIYRCLDYKRFPALASFTSRKLWTLHLFEQIEVGVCYVQVTLQKKLGFTTHHALVVSILNQHKHCISEEELIAMLEEN